MIHSFELLVWEEENLGEDREEVEQPKANHVGIPNGHSNGDTNGEATIIKASEDNHVEAPMVAAAE